MLSSFSVCAYVKYLLHFLTFLLQTGVRLCFNCPHSPKRRLGLYSRLRVLFPLSTLCTSPTLRVFLHVIPLTISDNTNFLVFCFSALLSSLQKAETRSFSFLLELMYDKLQLALGWFAAECHV